MISETRIELFEIQEEGHNFIWQQYLQRENKVQYNTLPLTIL